MCSVLSNLDLFKSSNSDLYLYVCIRQHIYFTYHRHTHTHTHTHIHTSCVYRQDLWSTALGLANKHAKARKQVQYTGLVRGTLCPVHECIFTPIIPCPNPHPNQSQIPNPKSNPPVPNQLNPRYLLSHSLFMLPLSTPLPLFTFLYFCIAVY
jgi:hypothetical protein